MPTTEEITQETGDQAQESGGTTLSSTPPPEEVNLKEDCFNVRGVLEVLKPNVLTLKSHKEFKNQEKYAGQHGEMRANIMLAYRHLEDARMRMGKVIQAYDGGTSCYSK